MMASLNQSSSASRVGTGGWRVSTFTTMLSWLTAEQEGGVALRVDAQAHAAPFERVALAGYQVFDRLDSVPRPGWTDIDVAKMEPELARPVLGQRHRHRHRILAIDRLLHVANDSSIVDLGEAKPARLQQRGIGAADAVKPADIVLDVAGLVPVAELQLVFLGIEIFLFTRNSLVLHEFESVVDAVVSRERRRQRNACLKDPQLA